VKRPFESPPTPPEAEKLNEALERDTDFMLGGAQLGLEETGNPYWAWYGVDLCIKAKKPFPDWLAAYLAQCADRLLSDRAKGARDLRKILPWALGFPNKRGPGNPLDIGRDRHKRMFALAFAIQLDKGDDPSAARLNACNAMFEGKYANVDDRTLQRWLLDVFGLKKAPPNVTEWKNVTNEYFEPYSLAIRDLQQRMKSRDILS
jgi:hypothetical protein